MRRTFILAATLLIGGCSYITSHPDSPLEELAEECIQAATGLDVDLSSNDGD